ncbi:MarR family winged helix-turn-helix transcriptional regulator [Hymenobacter coccineus]|uniref:HTH marR-type domain-containing protein n=1 Tax=Hymenobacter coccineus TaxID=1908235 RepID=A0A1G1STZ7_9BACT|nr:MarR family transcriptional regulator [Hymenobacter coccineus]OGX82092.1 hypothetical protein BEN49_02755 [Hymenobacter coccineus]
MKNILPVLQQLISELERYAQATSEIDLAEFAAWLHQRHRPVGDLAGEAVVPLHREPQYLNTLPPLMQLVPLVTRLNYFTHAAAEQLLAGLPIAGIREFSVLSSILGGQTPTKSEIAANAQLELSTVTEVTRRLVQTGLVTEVPDPKDRRARRLKITPAGQAVHTQGKALVAQLSQYLYDPLTAAEQTELHRLLSVLNTVHSAQPLPSPPPSR